MISVHANILIERPVEPVFAFVARDFFENYRRWAPQVESLERYDAGPLRVGSLARQVRVDHGRRTATTFTVVALEPPRQVAFEETGKQRYRLRYEFAPVGGAAVGSAGEGRHTRLTFVCELKRLSLVLRPFEPLLRAAVQEGVEQTVLTIKKLVE